MQFTKNITLVYIVMLYIVYNVLNSEVVNYCKSHIWDAQQVECFKYPGNNFLPSENTTVGNNIVTKSILFCWFIVKYYIRCSGISILSILVGICTIVISSICIFKNIDI